MELQVSCDSENIVLSSRKQKTGYPGSASKIPLKVTALARQDEDSASLFLYI